jgi:hypothetical protein
MKLIFENWRRFINEQEQYPPKDRSPEVDLGQSEMHSVAPGEMTKQSSLSKRQLKKAEKLAENIRTEFINYYSPGGRGRKLLNNHLEKILKNSPQLLSIAKYVNKIDPDATLPAAFAKQNINLILNYLLKSVLERAAKYTTIQFRADNEIVYICNDHTDSLDSPSGSVAGCHETVEGDDGLSYIIHIALSTVKNKPLFYDTVYHEFEHGLVNYWETDVQIAIEWIDYYKSLWVEYEKGNSNALKAEIDILSDLVGSQKQALKNITIPGASKSSFLGGGGYEEIRTLFKELFKMTKKPISKEEIILLCKLKNELEAGQRADPEDRLKGARAQEIKLKLIKYNKIWRHGPWGALDLLNCSPENLETLFIEFNKLVKAEKTKKTSIPA